jgi:T-complex protein 1 subunit theta
MNKMIINHLGKLFVTSDCATIVSEMEIEHPAAKMVVMAAEMQEREIGDGSNFVIVLCGELLSQAEELILMGLHPTEILTGYQEAGKKALELLEDLELQRVDSKSMFDVTTISKAISPAIASKQYGYETFLSKLVAEACVTVMPKNPEYFSVDNVRVVKLSGGSIEQSELIKGMVLARDTEGTVKKVKDAKIAVFLDSISHPDTETKGTVLLHSADELLKFNVGEEKEMERVLKGLADSGVKVVVTGENIDDIALHFLEKFGIMALKVKSKHDLRRLCSAVKARPCLELGPVPTEYLGYCAKVYVKEVGDKKITIFQQEDRSGIATIILRAATESTLNDLEKAIDDGVNVVKAMGKDGRFVAGGGASEIELSRRLGEVGSKSAGLDQYSIKKFAESFEVIPRTLAENAGLPATDTISNLYAAHEKKGAGGGPYMGVDIKDGGVTDMAKEGVLDLLLTKQQAIKLAIDAVTTILRVDQIIVAKPAGGPKMKKQGHWDDNEG